MIDDISDRINLVEPERRHRGGPRGRVRPGLRRRRGRDREARPGDLRQLEGDIEADLEDHYRHRVRHEHRDRHEGVDGRDFQDGERHRLGGQLGARTDDEAERGAGDGHPPGRESSTRCPRTSRSSTKEQKNSMDADAEDDRPSVRDGAWRYPSRTTRSSISRRRSTKRRWSSKALSGNRFDHAVRRRHPPHRASFFTTIPLSGAVGHFSSQMAHPMQRSATT